MKKIGLILFTSAYLFAGIFTPAFFIDPCKQYFNWMTLSALHFAARLVYKKVAAKESPILQKREIVYYLLVNIAWILSYVGIRHCY